MVQIHSGPPCLFKIFSGALAQLGERLLCTQEVRSSILLGSTNYINPKFLEEWNYVGHLNAEEPPQFKIEEVLLFFSQTVYK
jgi:hypothetical protein